MRKIVTLLTISLLSCNTPEPIKAAPEQEPAQSPAPDTWWGQEKTIVVDGNRVTRINDHETKAICYLASRHENGLGSVQSSEAVAVSIYCLR
jgi:hypothetical protein